MVDDEWWGEGGGKVEGIKADGGKEKVSLTDKSFSRVLVVTSSVSVMVSSIS